MAEMRIQLQKPLQEKERGEDYHDIYLQLNVFLQFIYSEREIIYAFLQSSLEYRIKILLYEEIVRFSQEEINYQQSPGYPIPLYIYYSNSAITGAVFYWIESGFQLTPKEFSEELTKISRNPPIKISLKS